MPLASKTGALGKKSAAHLLRRATFGATKDEIDHFSGLTATQAIAELFQSTPDPLPPVLPGASQSWVTMPPAIGEEDNDQQKYIILWWLGLTMNAKVAASDRMAFSTREKVTFFLHTLLTTIQNKVENSRALYFQNVLLRKYAFDGVADPKVNVRELTKKICVDNAMLALLDGMLNVKDNPNENFARELFELYTIGKGLSGQVPATGVPGDYYYFTEQDIRSAALVLSGFDFDSDFVTIDPDTSLPRGKIKAGNGGVPNQHDNGVKTFSNRMGNTVIQPNPALMVGGNPTEASVLDEISQLIDMIYSQAETPRYICRKIYRFYVYHDITTDIDSTIISSMVDTFKNNNYKIEPVIRELLCSQHFYDSADVTLDNDNFGAIIKSPLDLVAGTLNFFEYTLPDYISDTLSFYQKTDTLCRMMIDQGMDLMNPYDVAGYEAYHQYPLYNRHWINTNALTQRYKFIYMIMSVDSTMAEAISIDLLNYYSLRFASSASDPDALIREVASYLFPYPEEGAGITTERLGWFKLQFMKLGNVLNQPQPAFWQFSWNNRDNIPASQTDARGMLQDKINAMLQSPEYQLA